MANERTIVDVNLLKEAVAFTLEIHGWRANAKINTDKLNLTTSKSEVGASKKLLRAPELDAIWSAMSLAKCDVLSMAIPSYIRKGTFLVKQANINKVQARLDACNLVMKRDLIPAFRAVFAEAKERSKVKLEPDGMFSEADYPPLEDICRSFNVDWSWVAFSVPDALPKEIRRQEQEKAEKQIGDAAKETMAAFRQGFAGLVEHLLERLKPADPNQKGRGKVLQDRFVESFNEFLTTFDNRNLMNDTALADLVAKAKTVLADESADTLRAKRGDAGLTTTFAELKSAADQLVAEVPVRSIEV